MNNIFKKEFYNNKINVLSLIFISLYSLVALVSVFHLTSLISIADGWFITTLNSLSFVLGISGLIIAAFFSKIVKWQYKFLYWSLFIVLTGMELLGNIHHIHKNVFIDDIQPFCEVLGIDNINNDEIFDLKNKIFEHNNGVDTLNRPNQDSIKTLQANYKITKLQHEQDVYQKARFSRIMGITIVFIGMGFIALLMHFREKDTSDKEILEKLLEEENNKGKLLAKQEFELALETMKKDIEEQNQLQIDELHLKMVEAENINKETIKKISDEKIGLTKKINMLTTELKTINDAKVVAAKTAASDEAEVFGLISLKK